MEDHISVCPVILIIDTAGWTRSLALSCIIARASPVVRVRARRYGEFTKRPLHGKRLWWLITMIFRITTNGLPSRRRFSNLTSNICSLIIFVKMAVGSIRVVLDNISRTFLKTYAASANIGAWEGRTSYKRTCSGICRRRIGRVVRIYRRSSISMISKVDDRNPLSVASTAGR